MARQIVVAYDYSDKKLEYENKREKITTSNLFHSFRVFGFIDTDVGDC